MDLSSLLGLSPPSPPTNAGETILVSPLALLKMLKHGRAGVPMEVMGLMLGEAINDLTIAVYDVFAMPQSGTGQHVESIDESFQAQMLDKLKRISGVYPVVGWYHSHPGFGCWLSFVDQHTQSGMEALDSRQVALVVDPIKSVRGHVVIDCFRCINQRTQMQGSSAFQTATSIRGYENEPSMAAKVHGLNKQFYSMPIAYSRTADDEALLCRIRQQMWSQTAPTASALPELSRVNDLLGKYAQLIIDEGKVVIAAAEAVGAGVRAPATSTEGGDAPEAVEAADEAAEAAAKTRKAALEAAAKVFSGAVDVGDVNVPKHLLATCRSLFAAASLRQSQLESQAQFIRTASMVAEIDIEE